ncbi:MAG: Ku protein, partial [Terriglobales bacterium]
MPRAIWTGSLTFGLVNLPIGLFSATEDTGVHFHQFERGTSDRIRYQRVNERTGEKVDFANIVKGYEVDDGSYIVVESDELEKIAPGRSQALEIIGFVEVEEIDPIFFQKSYYLAPQGEAYQRTYALLLAALRQTKRAGVASLVMRGKEYLTVIRGMDDVIGLQTLHFAEEIRDARSYLGLSAESASFKGKELETAKQLIEAMSTEFKPEDYHDTYRERVMKLIDSKRDGETIAPEEAPPPATNVVDLMEALRRSVAKAGSGKQRKRTETKTRQRRKKAS